MTLGTTAEGLHGAPASTDASSSWDCLVDALAAYGVRYLSGGTRQPGTAAEAEGRGRPPDPATLMRQLAGSPEPRLRQALVALFLVHPELASVAPQVADSLPAPTREHLVHAYIAAVYLQRLWWTRLRRYLGNLPKLPPLWIEQLGLPPPDELFGRVGLAALAQRQRRLAGGRYQYRGSHEKVARLLFGQLLAERAAAGAAPGEHGA